MANRSYITEVVNRRPFGWEYRDHNAVTSFGFEEIDPYYWHSVFLRYANLPFFVGTLYILVIFGLQEYMKNKPALKLKKPLFWWNMGLGIFSLIGFVRTIPGFMYMISKPGGFYTSICLKKDTDIPTGYWTLMFVLSKFIELGDTVFIVLRKRPLIFLQWYHHLITMSVVWTLAPYMEPVTRWYTVLNYGVHSLMYPYFALKAIGIRIPNTFANLITTFQLAQMIIGFTVNMLSLYFTQAGYDCARYSISIKLFSVVYGSFLLLFGKLFYDAVLKSGRSSKSLAKKID